MSKKHPVIAVTGSSGAGTTTVKRAFEHIFVREKINAAVIEGDSFHWIAAESNRARAMRQWLEQRCVPKDWIKATGYWKAGPDDVS